MYGDWEIQSNSSVAITYVGDWNENKDIMVST